jgi:hypothetical protein
MNVEKLVDDLRIAIAGATVGSLPVDRLSLVRLWMELGDYLQTAPVVVPKEQP